eukprot:TRINITY_DN1312_c3_g1_i3.p1 TRINITY_DN1312_c3_g1~~TRINITY_DN1312_c3_g1_i3.p1  ORF type:complete len:558 (-),score=155.78 TRINITY_DN1312_c3_g1_i3:65-1738(-)
MGCVLGKHISPTNKNVNGYKKKQPFKKNSKNSNNSFENCIPSLEEFEERKKNKVYSKPKRLRTHTRETSKAFLTYDLDGNKVINNYIIIKTLGKGSYAKVKLCINSKDNEFYAIKILDKSKLGRRRLGNPCPLQDVVREIAIMKKLDHANIVKLYEVINDSNHDRLYMVMEYIEGGPIINGIGDNVDEATARKYFRDMIAGLEYLHNQKIIHRDIKPENLLLTKDGKVKITDFGVSHVFFNDDDTLSQSAGSPAFLPPELCEISSSDIKASGKAVDIWACGVTLYYIIFGELPFWSDNLGGIYESICNDELTFPEDINPNLKDILSRLLDKNPKSRIKMGEIKDHQWFTCSGALANLPNSSTEIIKITNQDVQNAISYSINLMKFKTLSMIPGISINKQKLVDKCKQLTHFDYFSSDTDTEDTYSSSITETDKETSLFPDLLELEDDFYDNDYKSDNNNDNKYQFSDDCDKDDDLLYPNRSFIFDDQEEDKNSYLDNPVFSDDVLANDYFDDNIYDNNSNNNNNKNNHKSRKGQEPFLFNDGENSNEDILEDEFSQN